MELRHRNLTAVHAGLEKGLKFLKAEETRVPEIEALSGRESVYFI